MPRKTQPSVIHPFDQLHGTDTSGLLAAHVIARNTDVAATDLTAYYGIAPSILDAAIHAWLQRTRPAQSIERTTFLDVGSGKGRAVLLASQHPFAAVEGVELNPALARIAERNLQLWLSDKHAQPLAPIRLHEADATKHPLPETPVLAFLFHPFEAPVLRRFLRHVQRQLTARPRPLDLLYVNAEHGSLLDRNRAFHKVWEGRIAMSTDDHLADLAEIAQQKEYGSTGDELCMIYRYGE